MRTSRLGIPARQPEQQQTEHMPRGQMIALLRMRKGGKDSLFAKALTCLLAVGSDDATQDGRYALAGAGLIWFDPKIDDWALLPRGLFKAEQVARATAQLYQIHHVTFQFRQPRTNTGSFAACSCGGWRQTVTRKSGDDNRLRRLAADHLVAVRQGIFKAPRPIEHFTELTLFDFGDGRTDCRCWCHSDIRDALRRVSESPPPELNH